MLAGALRLLRMTITLGAMLGVLAYAAAALLTVADVLGRRIGLPIVGVVDLVQLFVLSGAWLAIPYAFLVGAHVGVDVLVEAFSSRWQRAVRIVASLVAVGFLSLMLVKCVDSFRQQMLFGDSSQQLGIPIVWYWVPLLIGICLSILAAALTIVAPPTDEPT